MIRLEGVTKSYAGTTVLHGVSLDLEPGRVHGLVGENGAGKTTLVRIMSGLTPPDAGRVLLDGRPVTPRAAHGIKLVTQEVTLVPALSVLENVFLGGLTGRGGWWTPRADRRRLAALLGRTGFAIEADRPVRELSVADRQRVEILRALAGEPRVIALDEPTALLTQAEADQLLDLLRRLAADGAAVVLISHRLPEVLSACEVVTVLRDGRHVLTSPASEQTPDSLVRHMVGRPIEVLYPEPGPVADDAPVVLSVTGLRAAGTLDVPRLEVRSGEIVGLAGLVGSGRTRTLRLLFGAERRTSGRVEIDGQPVRQATPAAAMARGMAMVPESRQEQGLVLVRSLRENLALASLPARRRAGFVRRAAEARDVAAWTGRLDITAADPRGPVAGLSGGNQQKAMFGKWLLREPRVLLVDEPTRGVDVAVKIEIHRLLVELAARGIAVLMVSSEIEEVLGLSHRVLVMRAGRVVGEFARGSAAREDVMALAFAGEPS
ncbi:sugar ABC transporter ATP-binding protein [Nonomuraea sediminis]|uniref:sugar ABC transporter ATP-binding protein n=1 Tax=Nonomuraea sediminis TaxID=2835864 RepID=UPI001BDD79E0|nr:sugar ABC transporter ATP-binding protein [Nonomuraea sediminis]